MLHIGPLKLRPVTVDLTHLRFPWEQQEHWSLNLHWSSYFAEAKTFTLILSTSVTMSLFFPFFTFMARAATSWLSAPAWALFHTNIRVQPKSVGGRFYVCRLRLRSLFDSSLWLRFLVHFCVKDLKWPPCEKVNKCLDCWLRHICKLQENREHLEPPSWLLN